MLVSKRRFKAEPLLFHSFNYAIMLLIVVVTMYPFLNTLAVSFNVGTDTTRGGIYLLPRVWTFENYEAVFVTGHVAHAFWMSVARTVIGTVLGVYLTAMLAYTVSRNEYMFRKPITLIFVLTMYFSAGLIPSYFLIKDLHLLNHFMVYILPGLISAFNMLVIRTYIRTLPESLIESVKIDGGGDFRVFVSVILPLCKPVLATIALFIAVGQWNSWFDTFLYASSKQNLSTLQFELIKLLSSTTNSNASSSLSAGVKQGGAEGLITPLSIRAAITIVASLPILVVYPFLQKHFVAGLQLGSVKE
ncbi:sugar ABC transporter permease [Paenibacillus baekrokdamisoli]|uniref:Sugar ABC transporter permease n=1 Tax=Paenibacillus baekrokdamisoli TaxID=1712516 RepID=A0A3G9IVN1_9BACL|nr:carbohydrate ABC transporter permease [Paenibacillus baekrokdamisoli]MBB3068418.1 putative aldouronate transport system permease protein [Paenibacillus baekrokdamisoli]BBH22536.1 sugar ABC transporter permease [Paenibacillus baekrokdamisoli]